MIYEKVKSIAEKEGFTIASLERAAGLSNGTIGKWQDSTPTVDSILKVARILKVPVETLIDSHYEVKL